MKVRAIHQLAYGNKLHLAGEIFEMQDEHLERYRTDVTLVKDGAVAKRTIKPVRNVKTK